MPVSVKARFFINELRHVKSRLDEFQWMAAASPELPSVLQECWDRRWKNGRIMLILCGSYLGSMEREVLGKKSPLFGRRTAQILLRPFGYRQAAEFHPHWSRPNQAAVYYICGGLPFYLRYSLEDPLLRFWFRFVYPNLSLIARLGAATAVRELVLPALDSYFGHGFERLCREALPALYAREGVRAGGPRR